LCKYQYGGKYCAHKLVDARECAGEKHCMQRADRIVPTMNIDCSAEQWYGLYCSKYQRFYCPGKEKCGSLESYLASFTEYKGSLGRI
jgi:hypothetical protein